MKSLTLHLMLGLLKSEFVKIQPELREEFRKKHPEIDMEDCTTLLTEKVSEISDFKFIDDEQCLSLIKEEMEIEADTITDFLLDTKKIIPHCKDYLT